MLDEAYAAVRALSRVPKGANLMYFETGQGAALSAEAHHGFDQQTMEARADEIAARLGAHGRRAHRRAAGPFRLRQSRRPITYDPKPGATRDPLRNCVSNIPREGLSVEEASRRIIAIMSLARAMKRTGAELKEDDALASAPPAREED